MHTCNIMSQCALHVAQPCPKLKIMTQYSDKVLRA